MAMAYVVEESRVVAFAKSRVSGHKSTSPATSKRPHRTPPNFCTLQSPLKQSLSPLIHEDPFITFTVYCTLQILDWEIFALVNST